MRIVLFTTSHHLGANIALSKLLDNPDLPIAGIVRTKMATFSWKTFGVMRKFVGQSGFLYFFQTIFFAIWHETCLKWLKFFLPKKTVKTVFFADKARERNIPVLEVEDINSKAVRHFFEKVEGNIGVSVFLMQKVGKDLLNLPKNGCINLHPGLFPKYKGTFMHFWPLVNREKWSGVTIHEMTEQFDDGKVLAVKRFRIHRRFTQHCLMEMSAKVGSSLLVNTLKRLKRRETINVQIARMKVKMTMFSYPTVQALEKFRKLGKRFLRGRHFFPM
jgi:folate-dependent phosphoribosylglycinamide formyltransferase PurN